MGTLVYPPLLKYDCILQLLTDDKNSLRDTGYKLSLSPGAGTRYDLSCKKENEHELIVIPLFLSSSIDKYSQKKPPKVFKTGNIETAFNTIIQKLTKKTAQEAIEKLKTNIYKKCGFKYPSTIG